MLLACSGVTVARRPAYSSASMCVPGRSRLRGACTAGCGLLGAHAAGGAAVAAAAAPGWAILGVRLAAAGRRRRLRLQALAHTLGNGAHLVCAQRRAAGSDDLRGCKVWWGSCWRALACWMASCRSVQAVWAHGAAAIFAEWHGASATSMQLRIWQTKTSSRGTFGC